MESNTLKSLCTSNGWCYAVFWGFHPPNHMLLTMEDAYFDKHVESVVSTMPPAQMLADGIIGQAAIDGKHRWMLLHGLPQGNSEFNSQVLLGIKTVAVIPVESRGVLQFGSTKEIPETREFLSRAKKYPLHEGTSVGVPSRGRASSSLNYDQTDLNGMFASVSSSSDPLFDTLGSCFSSNNDPLTFFDQTVNESGMNWCNDGDLTMNAGPTFDQEYEQLQLPTPFFEMDDVSQWLADPSNLCFMDLDSMVSDNIQGQHSVGPLDFKGSKVESLPVSECVSGTEVGPTAASRKGLFSELGLEHLLNDSLCTSSSITKTYLDDECPTKRRRIETDHTIISKNIQFPTSSGGLIDCKPKSQTSLWIDDNYSKDARSSIISGSNTQTKTEESVKTTKKRAKPGESTRPRPKDRQMIADRIKELRDLIPDGAKLSIDALLGRTIKHMVFMQSLAKHADKLKQVDKPKLIGESNSLVQNGGGSQSRGATWAYEVGSRNMFCPIIVEDLDHPGQMLIEMLCEDQGYLLEIADIVRDLGLTILKGVMEARDDKMWAHFIVEGNKHVNITRMEVFVSLMQLLQGTCISREGNKRNESISKTDNNEGAQLASLWRNLQSQQVVI